MKKKASNRVGGGPKTTEEILARAHTATELIGAGRDVIRTAIRWGVTLGLAYFGYQTARVWAGKSTVADIGLKLLSEVNFSQWAGWAAAAIFACGSKIQAVVRKKVVRALADTVKKQEEEHDPDRSSSGLDKDGRPPRSTR